jgi:hypothetical protein
MQLLRNDMRGTRRTALQSKLCTCLPLVEEMPNGVREPIALRIASGSRPEIRSPITRALRIELETRLKAKRNVNLVERCDFD